VQARVVELVAREPGCSIQQVAVQLRVSHATASYHLFALGRMGLLVQVRDGREVRHFPGNAAPPSGSYLEALVRDERKARVVRLLAASPTSGMTVHQMAKACALSFALTKRTLEQLEWAHVVRLERRRYRYHVHVEAGMREHLAAIAPPEPGPLGDDENTFGLDAL
jgi:DNA-binding transcriptional ArsR family regulator